MSAILFDMPDEEDPEPGLPNRVEHGCDYMKEPNGKLMYFYNFIVYAWLVDGEEIGGRMYLDDRHSVSVFVSRARLLEDVRLQPIVRFLQRRFGYIKSFHADNTDIEGTGYTQVYRNHKFPEQE